MAKGDEAFYFGCYDLAGHYLYAGQKYEGEPTTTRVRYAENNPWGLEVDGGLCPGGKDRHSEEGRAQVQGRALLHSKDGWTAMAFWDRSVDSRPNSCSVFMFKGDHDFEAMMAKARKFFPIIAARFRFEVVNTTPADPVTIKESGKSR